LKEDDDDDDDELSCAGNVRDIFSLFISDMFQC